jgi:uncharacterized protein (DUF885 family)
MKLIRTALLATALTLPVLAEQNDDASAAAAAPSAQQAEHDKLFKLFAESDERSLDLNPIGRLFRGDTKNAGRLGDYLTDAQFIAGRTDIQLNLALLALVDRRKLSETDQLAYDVFKYTQEQNLRASSDEIRALT